MFENFHDYAFRVKCNDNPLIIIKVVAEKYDEAVTYAKDMYATNYSIYADDRYNLWQVEPL